MSYDDKCRYYERCPLRMPACSKAAPRPAPVGGRHAVCCILYGGG
ncbi:MAG: hypothetical protein QXU97_03850 [Fervidicoccaceae archaeon]